MATKASDYMSAKTLPGYRHYFDMRAHIEPSSRKSVDFLLIFRRYLAISALRALFAPASPRAYFSICHHFSAFADTFHSERAQRNMMMTLHATFRQESAAEHDDISPPAGKTFAISCFLPAAQITTAFYEAARRNSSVISLRFAILMPRKAPIASSRRKVFLITRHRLSLPRQKFYSSMPVDGHAVPTISRRAEKYG